MDRARAIWDASAAAHGALIPQQPGHTNRSPSTMATLRGLRRRSPADPSRMAYTSRGTSTVGKGGSDLPPMRSRATGSRCPAPRCPISCSLAGRGLQHGRRVAADRCHGLNVALWGSHATARGCVARGRRTPRVIAQTPSRLTKYADCVVADDCRFFFRDRQGRTCAAAESLQAFRRLLAAVSDDVLSDHAHRGDFSQ